MKPPLITLTTDFGLIDEYVGVMKGVIYRHCPRAIIVDLSHGIRPQDIRQGALVLAAAHRFFPAGTIHVVVIDPGVGTARRILLLKANGQLFLLPDNGVGSLLPAPTAVHEVTNGNLFLHPVSRTFHGRDIFAPVAAALANGLPAAAIGPPIPTDSLVRLPFPPVRIEGNELRGTVIDIDRFGNLITTIDRPSAETFCCADLTQVTVTIGACNIPTISPTYDAVPAGRPVALFGSRGLLEIGINRDNGAQRLGVALDSEVVLRRAWTC